MTTQNGIGLIKDPVVITYRNEEVKKRFRRYRDVYFFVQAIKEKFGVLPEIKIISINRVFRATFCGQTVKVRVREQGRRIHQLLCDEKIRHIPRVLYELPYENNLYFLLTEWVPGIQYGLDALRDFPEVNKTIPPKYFYQMGEILANIANLNYQGMNLGMSDLYWTNFVVHDAQLYLVDISKIYKTDFPEYFIITQLLMHPYTPYEKKTAFVEAYLKFRKPSRKYLAEILKVFLEKDYA